MLSFLSKLFGSGSSGLLGEAAVGGMGEAAVGSMPNLAEMSLSGAGQMAQLTGQGAGGLSDILTQTRVPVASSGFSDFLAKKQMQMLMDIINLKQGDPSGMLNRAGM